MVEKLITPRLEFVLIEPDKEPKRLPVPDVGTDWLKFSVKAPDAVAPAPVDVAVITPKLAKEGVIIETSLSPINDSVRVSPPLPKVMLERPFEN